MATAVIGFVLGSVATYFYTRWSKNQKDGDGYDENDVVGNFTATRNRSSFVTPGGGGGTTTTSRSISVPSSILSNRSAAAAAAAAQGQVGFLSDLLAQLWPYLNEAACSTIKETVEPTFAETMPGPLASLHFTKLDLGKVPIRLDDIVVHTVDKESNRLQFDLNVLWDGSCNIQLKADYLGSFGVKSIKFAGRMTVLLQPLVPDLSVVQAVQVSFVNPPKIGLDFVGLANVADLKLIKNKIQDSIQDILQSMIVLPQRYLTKLDSSCSFYRIAASTPMGVLRFSVVRGKGFKNEERTLRKADIPDVYAKVTLGGVTQQTTTQPDSLEPNWQTSGDNNNDKGYVMDFMVFDHDQYVYITVFDEDTGTLDADDFLGETQVTVGELLLNSGGRGSGKVQELELYTKDNKSVGAQMFITAELLQFTPTLTSIREGPTVAVGAATSTTSKKKGKKKSGEDDNNQDKTSGDLIHGVLTIQIPQAYNLPIKKKEEVIAYVKVTCNTSEDTSGDQPSGKKGKKDNDDAKKTNTLFVTPNVTDAPGIDCLNPVFDYVCYVSLTSKHFTTTSDGHLKLKDITLQLMNGPQTCLLSRTVTQDMLMNEQLSDHVWTETYSAPGNPNGPKLDYRMILRGLAVPKSITIPATSAAAQPNKSGSTAAATSAPPSTATTTGDDFSTALAASSSVDLEQQPSSSGPRVRVTVVKGHGFQIQKRRGFRRNDIPDVYCQITFGSSPTVWRTATVKNSVTPVWNNPVACREYPLQSHGQVIHLEAYDEDSGKRDKDDFLGSARITVGQVLLAGGSMDVELLQSGNQPTGCYIKVQCATLE